MSTKRNGLYIHPGLERRMLGRHGAGWRACIALLTALMLGIIPLAFLMPRAVEFPDLSAALCPPGTRLGLARAHEVAPTETHTGAALRTAWLGCRDVNGRVLPDRGPHDLVRRTIYVVSVGIIFWLVFRGLGRALRARATAANPAATRRKNA